MATAIRIVSGRDVLLSNVVVRGFSVGIDVEDSFVRLRRVVVGNTLVPLLVRDYSSRIVFEGGHGLMVW